MPLSLVNAIDVVLQSGWIKLPFVFATVRVRHRERNKSTFWQNTTEVSAKIFSFVVFNSDHDKYCSRQVAICWAQQIGRQLNIQKPRLWTVAVSQSHNWKPRLRIVATSQSHSMQRHRRSVCGQWSDADANENLSPTVRRVWSQRIANVHLHTWFDLQLCN